MKRPSKKKPGRKRPSKKQVKMMIDAFAPPKEDALDCLNDPELPLTKKQICDFTGIDEAEYNDDNIGD